MAIGDIYEVVMRGSANGQAVYNVLHFRAKSATAVPLLLPQAVGDNLYDVGTLDGVQTLAWSDQTWPEASIQLISPTLGAQVVVPLVAITGNAAGGAVQNAAVVVTWRTALGGRSFRGRSYFGAVDESVMANGLLLTNIRDALQNGITTFLALYGDGGTSADWEFGVWSPLLTTFTPVTAGVIRLPIRSQRRRNVGIGI